MGKIARGLGHWAIPQEEALHLCETVHSGLMIGAQKCSGDKALCAHCLKNGRRTEETAAHVHHKCPKAKAVWQVVIADWNAKTGDQVSTADLTAAVCRSAYVPTWRDGRGEGGVGGKRAGVATAARGHAARDLSGALPHARGIPRQPTDQPESY